MSPFGEIRKQFSQALMLEMPCVIKAKIENNERIIEVEASNENVDSQGDVMLQSALMDSSADFLKYGHLDIDHISEIGERYGIRNPQSYIVGVPTKVIDLGDKRTAVRGRIYQNPDGTSDPKKFQYDKLWESLQDEAVKWRASVFGFAPSGGLHDCKTEFCSHGATRFQYSSFIWTSLALTKKPVNDSIIDSARIIVAKAWADDLAMRYSEISPTMMSVWSARVCDKCECHVGQPMTFRYQEHFINCRNVDEGQADLYAHALMHYHARNPGTRNQ